MFATLRVTALIAAGSLALTACSSTSDLFGSGGSSSDVTTQSLAQSQPKIDPACGNLALDIDTLRREGIADKVEKAAAKKYKMTPADLSKANQLNKANAEFQSKCSTLPRSAAVSATPAPAAVPAAAAQKASAVKAAAPAKAASAVGAATAN